MQTNTKQTSAGKIKLFADTVARFDEYGRKWHLMNRQAGGWGERSIALDSIADLSKYAVTFGVTGCDKHGTFIQVFSSDRSAK